jgi:hypothetical protein
VQYLHDNHLVPEEPHVKRRRSFVLVPALVLFAAAADAQTVTLRYRWTKGEARTYRIITQTDTAITGMPGSGPMSGSQTMTQVLRFAAEDVSADGVATVRQTFQSIRMESSGPMGKLVVDSATPDTGQNPAAQGMRRVLAALAGESVVFDMTADGTVRRVEGVSRLADKLAGVMASDPAAGQAGQVFKSALTDEALKNTLEQTFPRIAVRPLKVGDTWTGDILLSNPMIGRITGRSIFTVKTANIVEDQPPAAVISVGLILKQEVVPPPSGPAAMVMTLGDAKGAGEIMFNTARNQIELSTMRTELPSSVTMNAPDGSVATAHNKTTITMKMELQK